MSFSFGAYVTETLFDRTGAVFALGDGTVRFEAGGERQSRIRLRL